MIDESKPADNQISDTVLVQEIKEIFEILDSLHRFYGPFLLAFLFDERPLITLSISLRMATKADKRCSGDCCCQKSRSQASASLKFAALWAMIVDLRPDALSLMPIVSIPFEESRYISFEVYELCA
jgi:hypothetical protein